jgi:hypothetical protein
MNGEDEYYIIDAAVNKVDLCGYHDLSSCRFVIEKATNGDFVPIEIITHSKKYSDKRISEVFDSIYKIIDDFEQWDVEDGRFSSVPIDELKKKLEELQEKQEVKQ